MYNQKKYTDLNETHRAELEAELNRLEEVRDKLRYLDDKRQQVTEDTREADYNANIKNKVFIWVRDKGQFELVRAKTCTNWDMYNSCNAIILKMFPIRYNSNSNDKEEYNDIRFSEKDTIRVDMLGKELKLATDEDIENSRQLLYKQIDRYIQHFK